VSPYAGMPAGELERIRRDLMASLALAREGSPVSVPIRRQAELIDAELAVRFREGERTDG